MKKYGTEQSPGSQTNLEDYFTQEARQPTADFREDLIKSQPLFKEAVRFYDFAETKPKAILDYECGFISLGMIFKKTFSDAEIVFSSDDGKCVQSASTAIEKMKWGDCAAVNNSTALSLANTYDLIIINELDIHKDPQDVLESVAKKLSPNGCILVTTRFGDQAPTYKRLQEKSPQDLKGKRWNLGMHELQDIFADAPFFRAKMFAEDVTESGSLQSHWITLVRPPKTFGKVCLDRKRLVTRPYESVCLCMIANEQEHNIFGALELIQTSDLSNLRM